MKTIPLSEAKFLDWLEPHMEQRMVPPKKDQGAPQAKKPQPGPADGKPER